MHIVLLILALLVSSTAHAANDYEPRVRKVEAIAKKNTNFTQKHDLLLEAASVCGSGDSYHVQKGRFADVELNWLRQLLRYRFNGTSVTSTVAGRISFEESAGVEVTDAEIQKLLASAEFSKWVGSDLVRSLSRLMSARAELKSNAAQLPQHPEPFLRHTTYKRYSSTASSFQRQLARKFKIIAIDNLVDCD